MATGKPRVYLDSCYYIDVARGRTAAPVDPNRVQDLPFVESLLLAAEGGDIEIYASTLVISECLFIDRQQKDAVPESVRQMFMSLLTSGQTVKLIAVDLFVAERARDLLWVDGINCGGASDSIHVATALDLKCEEFITANRNRGPLQGQAPALLAKLDLRVIKAHQTAVLPPKYKKPLLEVAEREPDEPGRKK